MDTQVNFSLKVLFLSLLKCTLFFLLLSKQLIAAEKNLDSSLLFIAASTNEVIKEIVVEEVQFLMNQILKITCVNFSSIGQKIPDTLTKINRTPELNISGEYPTNLIFGCITGN